MQYNKVEISGVNTAELPVLKEAKKLELLKKVKEGDKKAREELINGNLRLVLSVLQMFAGRGDSPDDLFQVGVVGLIKAIDNFSLDYDVKFSTYAFPMILGEIRRYLRDNFPIRVSRSLRDMAYKAMQAKEKYINEHQREPKIEEIAKMIDAKPSEVVTALESICDPISIYEPVYSDSGDTLFVLDQIGDGNNDISWLNEISLKEAIAKLMPREKNILSLRFFQGKTQVEVAKSIGISQAQVSRLEKGALEQIKKQFC